jgi:single-stranded DNA-binding protein
MSAYALITGVVYRAPTQRTAKSGKPYTICTIKVGADEGAADFWNALIFSESAQLEMLRLEVGDAVAIRGKFKTEIYVANDGSSKISRTIFADAALGLRPAARTSKAKAPPVGSKAADAIVKQSIDTDPDYDLNDSIPF